MTATAPVGADPVAGGVGLLQHLLTRQRAMYIALGDLLRRKKEAVTQARFDDIAELCTREEQVILQVKQVEMKRQSVVQGLARQLGLPTDQIRLANICAALPESLRRSLEPIAEELKAAVDHVQHESAVIRDAAEALATHMSGILQTVQSSVNRAGVYEQNGRLHDRSPLVTAVDVKS